MLRAADILTGVRVKVDSMTNEVKGVIRQSVSIRVSECDDS